MIQAKSTTILGHEFTVVQLPGTRAFRFANRVGQLIAPVLAKAAGAMDDTTALLDGDISKLEPAIIELASRLDPNLLDELMWEALAGATMDGKGFDKSLFDGVFQGRPLASWKLFVFAMKVQLADFFDESGDLVRFVRRALRASDSAVSTTSSGPSGG